MKKGLSCLFLAWCLTSTLGFKVRSYTSHKRHKTSIIFQRDCPLRCEGDGRIGESYRHIGRFEYILGGAWLTTGSMLFPVLLSHIVDLNESSFARQSCIIGLLLAKRVYLYAIAVTALIFASKRSIDGSSLLGNRITALNKEILGLQAPQGEEEKEFVSILNETSETSQSLAIPVVIASSLLVSFFFLSSAGTDSVVASTTKEALLFFTTGTNILVSLLFTRAEIAVAADVFLSPWRDVVLGEADGSGRGEDEGRRGLFVSLLSIGVVFGAFCSPPGTAWPLHNLVNTCIAVTVARLLQLSRLPLVLLALGAVAAYDVIAVMGSQVLTDGGASVMEAVAMAKLEVVQSQVEGAQVAQSVSPVWGGSGAEGTVQGLATQIASLPSLSLSSWRPGLFEIGVSGRVSDALGVGDVVFPSMLTGWALRTDLLVPDTSAHFNESDHRSSNKNGKNNSNDNGNDDDDMGRHVIPLNEAESPPLTHGPLVPAAAPRSGKGDTPLFQSCLWGYVAGCVLCEVFQTGGGQPALLYIVPSMVAALTLSATLRGKINDLFISSIE